MNEKGNQMDNLSRRAFHHQTLSSLLTLSLLETLFSGDAFADAVKPIAAKWLAHVNEMCADLKDKKLEQRQWQEQVEALFAKVPLSELLAYLDFDKLTQNMTFRDRGERVLHPDFPEVEGLPTELVFGHQLFALRKDRSVVPHAHDNMATAFLVLQGEFRGRHYDRLKDEKEHMIIAPTLDRSFRPGEYSTVSDFKDNIHWFQSISEAGYIFNIHVLNLMAVPERGNGRVYVDPNGEGLGDGTVRARIIKSKEALELYG